VCACVCVSSQSRVDDDDLHALTSRTVGLFIPVAIRVSNSE